MRFRDFIDPGGRVLAGRLDQLRDTLDHFSERLQATIADAIGQTLTGIIRDTARRVLDDFADYLPIRAPAHRGSRDNSYQDERNIWLDEEEEYDSEIEPQPAEVSSDRLATAVSAGMYVASLWLRRWTGNARSLTTAAVGVVAAGVAYVGGPIASAVMSWAGVATQFTTLSDAIGTGASTMNYFDPV